MTEWLAQVVKLGPISKLPNADTLGLTQVLEGYPVITKLDEFSEGDLAAYIPVDTLVPLDHELFKWLDEGKGKKQHRVKARKLRGTFSMGLLVPAPLGFYEGMSVEGVYRLEKYLPPAEREFTGTKHNAHKQDRLSETAAFERIVTASSSLLYLATLIYIHNVWINLALLVFFIFGGCATIKYNRYLNKRPNIPYYDLDGWRRYSNVFQEGEEVWVTEKLHGCQISVCWTSDPLTGKPKRFHVKSRTVFRSDTTNTPAVGDYKPARDVFWKAAKAADLKKKLKGYPGVVLFGEIYGKVQDLSYGVTDEEEVRFAAFDAMDLFTRKFMNAGDFLEFCRKIDVPVVPTLYWGPFAQEVLAMAEGKTVMPKAEHVREGIVIKPTIESRDNRIGRKVLKLIGEGYHLRKEAE